MYLDEQRYDDRLLPDEDTLAELSIFDDVEELLWHTSDPEMLMAF